MSNMLKYNGYVGSIEYSLDDEILYGKIECINDVVTYEATTVEGLKKEFILAVDDYLETCKQIGKNPDKPMSGSFNVRIGEDLHKRAYLSAKETGVTLNEFIKISISEKLSPKNEIHFHVSEVQKETRLFSGSFTHVSMGEDAWRNEGVKH
ncbi:type II toxin-antitoxin system HicB family antitoxin [Morganella morganii]|uniref:type II toxin-antitoxin system HicB family antitoxin n=1 Tax=Morganella morganii TaxID=582 RepID=UPI003EBA1D44